MDYTDIKYVHTDCREAVENRWDHNYDKSNKMRIELDHN